MEGKQGGRKEAGRQKEMVGCDAASVKASADPTRSTEVGVTSQSCSASMRGSGLKHQSPYVSYLPTGRECDLECGGSLLAEGYFQKGQKAMK